MTLARAARPVIFLALTGCPLPQSPLPAFDATVYQDTKDPMQYRSALPRDARVDARGPAHARGEACRTVLALPTSPPAPFLGSNYAAQAIPWRPLLVLFGDDSYARAVRNARASVNGAAIFDVRADMHTTAILGIWRQECTEIHALAER